MTPFPSFMPASIGAEGELPVGSFPFPTFGSGFDDAVVGGGDFAVAVTDRPEVRTPDGGAGIARLGPRSGAARLAGDAAGQRPLRPDEHRQPGHGRDRRWASRTPSAPATSASTPPTTCPQRSGSGRSVDGMVRLFREGSLENLDELSLDIARDIEATWVELEATAD